ncbi:hypothetical protein H9P43_002117 [Blastocladiella emersonii ATCC 22665]|nr:hypothetical protein H9P43_002117 [Blastocladiella emersonii ATCC 22665]
MSSSSATATTAAADPAAPSVGPTDLVVSGLFRQSVVAGYVFVLLATVLVAMSVALRWVARHSAPPPRAPASPATAAVKRSARRSPPSADVAHLHHHLPPEPHTPAAPTDASATDAPSGPAAAELAPTIEPVRPAAPHRHDLRKDGDESHSRLLPATTAVLTDDADATPPSVSSAQRRRARLTRLTHVLLLATAGNLYCTAALPYLFLFPPAARSVAPPASPATRAAWTAVTIALRSVNFLCAFTAQSAGELALLYKFSRVFRSRRAQWTVLPLVAILVAARAAAQIAVHVMTVITILDPFPAGSPQRAWLSALGSVYGSAQALTVLILSAAFVYKLGVRWRRHAADQRRRHARHTAAMVAAAAAASGEDATGVAVAAATAAQLKYHQQSAAAAGLTRPATSSIARVGHVLRASLHNTVLSAVSAVTMALTYPFLAEGAALAIVNTVAFTVYKMSFAAGIALSLYHMTYDQRALAERRRLRRRFRRRHRHFRRVLSDPPTVPAGAGVDVGEGVALERVRSSAPLPASPVAANAAHRNTEFDTSSGAVSDFAYNSWSSLGEESGDDGADDSAVPLGPVPIRTNGRRNRYRSPTRRRGARRGGDLERGFASTTDDDDDDDDGSSSWTSSESEAEEFDETDTRVRFSSLAPAVEAAVAPRCRNRRGRRAPEYMPVDTGDGGQRRRRHHRERHHRDQLPSWPVFTSVFEHTVYHQHAHVSPKFVTLAGPADAAAAAGGGDAPPPAPAAVAADSSRTSHRRVPSTDDSGTEPATATVTESAAPVSTEDPSSSSSRDDAMHLTISMANLRDPGQVVDRFLAFLRPRFARNVAFYPKPAIRAHIQEHFYGGTGASSRERTAATAAETAAAAAAAPPSVPLPPHLTDPWASPGDADVAIPLDRLPAVARCHHTMREVATYLPCRDHDQAARGRDAAAARPVALYLPVHFNGRKLGVLALTPWVGDARPSPSPCEGGRSAVAADESESDVPSTWFGLDPASVADLPDADRARGFVKQLTSFFGAYLYSAQLRQLNDVVIREFQQQLAVVEAAAKAKSTFLANMSHEIRTPAAQVIQAVHILAETDLTTDQREHVQVIMRSGEQLLAILNDILDFSKLEHGKIRFEHRPFDLHEAVRQSVDSFFVPSKRLDIGFVLDRSLPRIVVGDVIRLRQIFNNLLSNAIKFTESGSVLLHARRIATAKDSVRVHFAVVDTGCGIPEGNLQLIFERFEQSDETIARQYGGTGLGLSICQSLCALMHTRMQVKSELGKGSEFFFDVDLPLPPPAIGDTDVALGDPSSPVLDTLPKFPAGTLSLGRPPRSPSPAPAVHVRLVCCGDDVSTTAPFSDPVVLQQLSGFGDVVSVRSAPLEHWVAATQDPDDDPAGTAAAATPVHVAVVVTGTWPASFPPAADLDARLRIPVVMVSSSTSDLPLGPHPPSLALLTRPFKQSQLFRMLGHAVDLARHRERERRQAALGLASAAALPPSSVDAGKRPAANDGKSASTPPANNRTDSGTTASAGDAAAAGTAAADPPAPVKQSLRVLVVDDNPLNRRLMKVIVASLGHAVSLAENGQEAVDAVLATDFDAVFMDVRMPVMDGFQATRAIVEHYETLAANAANAAAAGAAGEQQRKRPVIMGLSADAMEEQESEGLRCGMSEYLRKPLLRGHIVAVLERYFPPTAVTPTAAVGGSGAAGAAKQ